MSDPLPRDRLRHWSGRSDACPHFENGDYQAEKEIQVTCKDCYQAICKVRANMKASLVAIATAMQDSGLQEAIEDSLFRIKPKYGDCIEKESSKDFHLSNVVIIQAREVARYFNGRYSEDHPVSRLKLALEQLDRANSAHNGPKTKP